MFENRFLLIFSALLVLFAVTAGRAEYVSIAEVPIKVTVFRHSLDRDYPAYGYLEPYEGYPPRRVASSESVRWFLNDALDEWDSFTSPCMHWVASATIPLERVMLDGDTYADIMQLFSKVYLPVEHSNHNGVYEFAWAVDAAQRQRTKQAFKQRVPPFRMFAKTPAQLMQIWHEVSGMEFEVDPKVVRKDMKEPLEELMHDYDPFVDPELAESMDEAYADSDSLPCTFMLEKPYAIDAFMKRLAMEVGGSAHEENGVWYIGPLERNSATIIRTVNLLKRIEEKSFSDKSNDVESLTRLGEAALPEIVKAHRDADHYLFDTLTKVLAEIPCEARDREFIARLDEVSKGQERELSHWYVPTMIQALSANQCKEAIPVLQTLSKMPGFGADARVALNILNVPPAERPIEEVMKIPANFQKLMRDDRVKKSIPVLHSVLDQCLELAEPIASVTDIRVEDTGVVQYQGPTGRHGVWTVRVGVEKDGVVYVAAEIWRGFDNAVSFTGKATQHEGRWLLVRWLMTRMS